MWSLIVLCLTYIRDTLESNILIVLGVILLGVVFLTFQLKYRCPYCHKILNSRKLTPVKVCPRCKKKLEDEEVC